MLISEDAMVLTDIQFQMYTYKMREVHLMQNKRVL